MFLLIPVAAWALLFAWVRTYVGDLRAAGMVTTVWWGACLLAITEALSVVNLITRPATALAWTVVCILAFAGYRLRRQDDPLSSSSDSPTSGTSTRLDWHLKVLLAACGVIAFTVMVLAFVAAPSTWDAMEYHLPRTVFWMSNHNVRFFATPDYCQLIFGPWAEYAQMQVNLLWGNDRFVNFVEFLAMLGSVGGASLIARELGAGCRGQALAAIVAATIPEGILEASGPMNTWVVTFWIVSTVYFLLRWNDEPSWLNATCIGLSAGIAVLTKGTAYVYLPFLVLACWCAAPRDVKVRFLKFAPLFLGLIVAVNGPQYYRAYEFTGSPLGLPFADGGPRLHWMADAFAPKDIAANVVRNASLHLVTPSAAVNGKIDGAVKAVIRAIGRDPDDPKTTWPNSAFESNHFSLHEIHAGNPLHFLLVVLALIAVFIFRKRLTPLPLWYSLGLIASFVMFCGLLRWQTWASRHHLAVFLLGSALAGLVLERLPSKKWTAAVAAALVLYALPFALVNRTRSLVRWAPVADIYHPREFLYFSDLHEKYAAANIAAAGEVNQLGCNTVAIDSYTMIPAGQIVNSPVSFFVYPLLAMIHADGQSVWYSGVNNWSSRYSGTQNHPATCAVVCFDCRNVREKWDQYRSVGGRATVHDYIVVFSAKGAVPNIAYEIPTNVLQGATDQTK